MRPRRLASCLTILAVIFLAGVSQPETAAARTLTGNDRVAVTGSTLYEAGQLLGFASQHVLQSDGVVTVDRLARAIELIYREDGYFLAEASSTVRPDGTVVFAVSEGRIDSLSIEGVDARTKGAIAAILTPLIGRSPIGQAEFERAVMLVNDLAGISVTTEIDYPHGTDGARLRVLASQRRMGGYATIDNPPRPFGESVNVQLSQEFYSTLIAGDLLRLTASGTGYFGEAGDGFEFGGIGYYRAPIGSSGLFAEAFLGNVFARRDSNAVLDETDLRGLNGGVLLGYPIARDLHHYQYALLEARHSEADSEAGPEDFTSTANVLSLAYLYGYNSDDGGLVRFGLSATAGWRGEDPAAGLDDGDDHFWHVRAGFGINRPLNFIDPDVHLLAEVWGQVTTSRLPSVEEFYLGDWEWLRGYSFAETNGDLGFTASLELSRTLSFENRILHHATPFLFLDFGDIRNNDADPFEDENRFLASAGIGSTFSLTKNVSLRGWLGVPLIDGPQVNQFSPSVRFSLTKAW